MTRVATLKTLKEFVAANRQKGSTTCLVEAVCKSNGRLIVARTQTKECLKKKHPCLSPDQILTMWDLATGRVEASRFDGPVFLDLECLFLLPDVIEDAPRLLSLAAHAAREVGMNRRALEVAIASCWEASSSCPT